MAIRDTLFVCFPLAKIEGVADKNQLRLKSMAEDHDVQEENRFTDWKEALNKTKFADAVIISLPDNLHYDPCMKALSMGYHILLEKPIAPTEKECTDIRDLAIKKNASCLLHKSAPCVRIVWVRDVVY